MKSSINAFLAILSPLAAVPTGWAIYAGVTETPVFPMPLVWAVIGAVAVIATSIAAGLLISDIATYNQGMKNKTEREELGMSTRPAWLIFAGCVIAEITLSLLIVVIPGALVFGVLVFPLMTAAGVFAFAARLDLQQRETDREQIRASIKLAKSEPKPKVKQEKPAVAPLEPAISQLEPAIFCMVAGCERNEANPKAKPFGSQSALNAHQRKHKQVVGYAVSFEPVTNEQARKAQS